MQEILQKDYEKASLKLKRLYNLYGQNGDELLMQTITENRDELEKIRKRIEDEKESQLVSGRQAEKKIRLKDIKTAWEYMTMQEKQFLVRQCVDKIVITDNKADIYYQFDVNVQSHKF